MLPSTFGHQTRGVDTVPHVFMYCIVRTVIFYRVTKNLYATGDRIWETGENNGFINNRSNIDVLLPLIAMGNETTITNILSSFDGDSFTNIDRDGVRSSYTEAVLEYTRAAEFPSLPIRYQNMHVCKTLDDAKYFRTTYRTSQNPKIYKIDTQGEFLFFSGDMNIYTYAQSGDLSSMIKASRRYWKSEFTENPFEEIILYPKTEVKVLAET